MFLPQFLSKFKTSFSFCLKTLIPLLFLYSTYQNQKEPSTNIWDRLSWNILKTTIWKLPQNLFFKSLKSNLRRGLSQESGSRQISWAHHGLIGISTKKQFQREGDTLKKKIILKTILNGFIYPYLQCAYMCHLTIQKHNWKWNENSISALVESQISSHFYEVTKWYDLDIL